MKKVLFPALAIATFLVSAFTTLNTIRWKIADGYAIKFSGKDVDGHFKNFSGDLVFDEKNLAASKSVFGIFEMRVGSIFGVTKLRRHDKKVQRTYRLPMGRNITIFQSKTQAQA